MVNLDAQLIRKEIAYYGSDVTVRAVSDDSYTKWGDAIEEVGASKVSLTTGDDDKSDVQGVNWLAQTFTTTADSTPPISDGSADFNITDIKLKLYRTGSPDTLTVSIRAVNGSGEPTGSDLSTGTMDCDDITTSSSGEWKIIKMSAYTLTGGISGTQYAIVIRATGGDGSNIVHVMGDLSSSTYTGGTRFTSADSGSSWADQASTDSLFQVLGDAVAVKAFVQVLNQDDELVKEGTFQSGDKLFWFKSNASNIARGNRVKHNSLWYEINEVVEHDATDATYALEARTKKV